jgi:NAD(P)-dependent dehydrogenase (short-subunit alcohol dehydrogenase family)
MADPRIALITGANQGLGFALAKGLAGRLDPQDLVLLTGRNRARIEEAIARLTGSVSRVEGHMLDVTDPAAVQNLADEVSAQYGGVDIVFSNAGSRMSPDRPAESQVDEVVETYNRGAIRMLRSFEPLLRPGGRFLVVASSFGVLGHLDPRLRPLFDGAETLDDLETVLAGWVAAVHDGSAAAQGWPRWLNIPSKIGQVAAVRIVAAARRQPDLADGTLIAAVCPGLIDTQASRPWFADMSHAQTPEQAADALLQLALAASPDPAQYGELIQFGRVLPWRADVAPDARAESRVRSAT